MEFVIKASSWQDFPVNIKSIEIIVYRLLLNHAALIVKNATTIF